MLGRYSFTWLSALSLWVIVLKIKTMWFSIVDLFIEHVISMIEFIDYINKYKRIKKYIFNNSNDWCFYTLEWNKQIFLKKNYLLKKFKHWNFDVKYYCKC